MKSLSSFRNDSIRKRSLDGSWQSHLAEGLSNGAPTDAVLVINFTNLAALGQHSLRFETFVSVVAYKLMCLISKAAFFQNTGASLNLSQVTLAYSKQLQCGFAMVCEKIWHPQIPWNF
jgi:hypothetical protein